MTSATVKENSLGFRSEELIDTLQLFKTCRDNKQLSNHLQLSEDDS